MGLQDRFGPLPEPGLLAPVPDPLLRFPGGCGRLHQRQGVVDPEHTARVGLGREGHRPGFMQVHHGHPRQFRQPLAQEQALGVVVLALLDRVVDPDRVDARGAGLHLALAPVDAGLVVHEQARQHQAAVPPRQPELIAGHRHQHRPHAEIDPARGDQGPHAGIHERQAGAPRGPGRQSLRLAGPQAGGERVQLLELQIRLAFQLLDEVAVPVQPLVKAPQGPGPVTPLRGGQALQCRQAAAAALHDFPQRQGAPTQVGREARAAGKGGARAGELPVVAGAPLGQKAIQQGKAGLAPSRLAARAGVGRQAQVLGAGDGAGLDAAKRR